MASVGGDSDNKLNTELNLVPFIDLFSSLVLFLLVTAVWVQVGTIPASVDSKGMSRTSVTEQSRINLHLSAQGVQIGWPGTVRGNHPRFLKVDKTEGLNFEQLVAVLEPVAKTSASTVVAVSSDDLVEYGFVVRAIDAAKKAGFHAVALNTN